LAKIAPVNMGKMIENARTACMEKMVNRLTDRVVERFEDTAEESRRKDEIRRGKQVEATLEDEVMEGISFEPGVTFSAEENKTVDRILREMEVEELNLEQSRHVPTIPPGEKKKEYPRLAVDAVSILKKKPVPPAVPQQMKKEVKKMEGKEVPTGPKAGVKQPEVKKPTEKKPERRKSEEKNKETWV